MLKGDQLKEAFEQYKNSISGLRQKSIKSRRNFIIRLEKFLFANCDGIFDLQSVTAFIDNARKKKDGSDLAKGSVNTYIVKLIAFNTYCIKKKILFENFCKDLEKFPEDETLPPPIHLDIEYKRVPEAITLGTTPGKDDRKRSKYYKNESRWMQFFMYHTGMRSGGVAGLTGDSLHFEAEIPFYIITLKGGKVKAFPLPKDEQLLEELRKRRNRKKLFDASPDITIKHFQNGLRAIGVPEAIVKEVNNHTFRKLYCQERRRNGSSAEEIADSIGDKIETVKKYYLGYDPNEVAPTVNNSRSIRHGQPLLSILDRFVEKIRNEVSDDDRVESPRQAFEGDNFVITVRLTQEGLEELKKNKRS